MRLKELHSIRKVKRAENGKGDATISAMKAQQTDGTAANTDKDAWDNFFWTKMTEASTGVDSTRSQSQIRALEAYANQQGKTYSEVFEEYMPTAIELMTEKVIFAREHGHDIIWDQTSTTVKSRKRKFNMLPNYYAIAIVFSIPEEKELKRRLNSRPGKEVPWDVVQGMIDNFEMPTEEEGFKEIWRV